MKHGCDDWKTVAEGVGLKSKREAILEFLRIPISDINREDHQYLIEYANQPQLQLKDFKEVEPYN